MDKYDELLHRLHESPLLSEEQLLNRVQELFPQFNPDPSTHHHNKQLTPYVIEQYAHSRSLGLSIANAAHTAEVSGHTMKEALSGKYVSLQKFGELVKAELFAKAETLQTHLKKLAAVSESGNYKATMAFLEKVFPEDYTPKSEIKGKIEHTFNDEEIKDEMSSRIRKVKANEAGTIGTAT